MSVIMMKKVVIHKPGSYRQLRIEKAEDPIPDDDGVLIEVKACGVNFADCCIRLGVYASAKKYIGWPITPGFEVSGNIIKVGKNVKEQKIGSRVIAVTRFGGYSSRIVVPANQVFPLPSSLSYEEGASLPAVFLTAYYGMHELAHPHCCSHLLIHSAAGGVGSALVQLGKAANCIVTGVVGSGHKTASVQSLGADNVIDKSTQPLWKKAEDLAPKGFDVIFDANGPETLKRSYQHLAPGGKLVVYGFHSMLSKGKGSLNWLRIIWGYLITPRFNPLNMTGDNRSVLAFNLSYLFDQNWMLQEGMKYILNLYNLKKIIPPPITVYSLENVQEAHRALESSQTIGKLILIP